MPEDLQFRGPVAETRILFYWIGMEDFGPYDGDITGTRVTGNIRSTLGTLIRRGISIGPH